MESRENELIRRSIIAAMLHVAEHRSELFEVCAGVEGDASSANAAIREAFGFDEMQAEAILAMQVRRFTPRAIQQMRAELAEVDARLAG